jgi:ubiquinone/menaquinone biosynthesis C-methylase UbiE
MNKKKWTGERLETTVFGRIAIEHLHRYALALNYVENKIVLDIASGEGYGSNLLSKKAKFVYGVDIDKSAVLNARNKYSHNKIQFLEGSTSKIPLKSSSVDIVTSFETIEHHDEHEQMMIEIKRVLKPNGILFISSPDKLHYSDYRNYKNEHHKKELYKKEFNNLLMTSFKNTELFSQTHSNGVSFILNEMNQKMMTLFSGNFSEILVKKKSPMFLVAIASDINFEKQSISIFDGSEVDTEITNKKVYAVKNSVTFKVGLFILLPIRILKKIISLLLNYIKRYEQDG